MLTSISETLTAVLGPLGPLVARGFLGLVLVAATLPVMLKKRADPDYYARARIDARIAAITPTVLELRRQGVRDEDLERD